MPKAHTSGRINPLPSLIRASAWEARKIIRAQQRFEKQRKRAEG